MKAFKTAVVVWALLPLITGLMDVIVGPSAWQGIGVGLSAAGFADSVLDSQVRFIGTIWFGYGVLLLVCLKDVEKYSAILQGAFLIVFLGGIGRVISVFQAGMPEANPGHGFIIFALVIELVIMPLLMLWQRRTLAGNRA
jgi:phosphosulfolactate synthase (CoM biosynthesis protein A)